MTEHIKIPDIAPLLRYTGDGVTTDFIYNFPIFASEDIHVYFNGAEQFSGFDITDIGDTDGGYVVFDTPPVSGMVITIERRLPLERVTDFIEGGDFSAQAINNALDYLTAVTQQISRDQSAMLRYGDHETSGNVTMPDKASRANKALGFDNDGNIVPLSLAGASAAPDYTAIGAGAVTRSTADKFKDAVSIKDFGAVGDGLTDDTIAIQQALAAHNSVLIPEGDFLVSATITLGFSQTLFGLGQASKLIAQNNNFNVIELVQDYATLSDFNIQGGDVGIKLYGRDRPCVQNSVTDIVMRGQNTGVQLDGYTDTQKPCYWNNFDRVLVEQPAVNGFHLLRSGAGDTPNANKFHACRAYSLSASISNAGFYIEAGRYNNSFIDCEANVSGTAQGCFIIGAGAGETILINPYAESNNQVPNIRLDAGSIETSIYNLLSVSDGPAIWDFSGGNYTAYNSGFPYKNRLRKTSVNDIQATLQRFDTEFIEASGTITLDQSHSMHLLSSFGGAVTAQLPGALAAEGCLMMIKKIDSSKNVITVTEVGGNGPDARNFYLGSENDYVMMLSNGAEWFVIASNRSAGNTRFFDGNGIYDIDMAVDTYFLSSFGGVLEARLPPANAPEAIGRTITIKKTDPSTNLITITEIGGNGPDNNAQALDSQYDAVTIVSDGGSWYILNRFNG